MQLKDALLFTDAGSVSRSLVADTEIGMAHFAGTGPAGKRCKDCEHFQTLGKKMVCWDYVRLTKDRKKSITGKAASCSHFQPK